MPNDCDLNELRAQLEQRELELSVMLHRYRVPPHMHEGILAYVLHGRRTGDFLRAVFSNDLVMSYARADTINAHAMHSYAKLLGQLPPGCWGSGKSYQQWLERGGLAEGEAGGFSSMAG